MSHTHVSDVDCKAHKTNLLHNILAKWTCFDRSNESFCSLLVLELLCTEILTISETRHCWLGEGCLKVEVKGERVTKDASEVTMR